MDEADAAHDLGRAERAREELQQIVALLSGALGLGGKSRGLGSSVERARSSVTWRIRSAIKRIESVHPAGPSPSERCPHRHLLRLSA